MVHGALSPSKHSEVIRSQNSRLPPHLSQPSNEPICGADCGQLLHAPRAALRSYSQAPVPAQLREEARTKRKEPRIRGASNALAEGALVGNGIYILPGSSLACCSPPSHSRGPRVILQGSQPAAVAVTALQRARTKNRTAPLPELSHASTALCVLFQLLRCCCRQSRRLYCFVNGGCQRQQACQQLQGNASKQHHLLMRMRTNLALAHGIAPSHEPLVHNAVSRRRQHQLHFHTLQHAPAPCAAAVRIRKGSGMGRNVQRRAHTQPPAET